MIIKESQLIEMVRKAAAKVIKEAFNNDDIEIEDDWNKPDEFDAEIEEPVDMGGDDINFDVEEKPEPATKADAKREKVANLIRTILAKQGYKGEKLEKEVAKRMGVDKPDAVTRRMDRAYDSADNVNIGGKNVFMQAGGIYDDDYDLQESIRKIVRKVLNETI